MTLKGHFSLDEYQKLAKRTNIYKKDNEGFYALVFGLAGESGEVADKVKKTIRDENGPSQLELALELGDVLWYVSQVADRLGYALSDISMMNVEKLKKRQREGHLSGSGDYR